MGILEEECKELNKRFFVFHKERRPYIVLKWAETGDGKIAAPSNFPGAGEDREGVSRLLISNEQTNRLVHKWRSEEMAILVGTKTALFDDPSLTTRLWPGKNPLRVVVDMDLRLPKSLKLFDGKTPTVVFNLHKHTLPFEKISVTDLRKIDVGYYQVTEDVSLVHQILNAFYQLSIQSVLIEGGAQLLQSFIDDGSWDEARIISNQKLIVQNGLPAPVLKGHAPTSSQAIATDILRVYLKNDEN